MASGRDDVLLKGEFLLLSKKKTVHSLTLTPSALYFHNVSNNSTTYEEKYLQIGDIIGCHSLENVGYIHIEQHSSTLPAQTCLDQTINTCKNRDVTSPPSCSFPRGTSASSTGFTVYAYPFKKKLFSSKRVRARQELTFELLASSVETFEEKRKVAETWCNVINCLCRAMPVDLNDIPSYVPPPREKMLLLINPHSGPGKAYTIFKNEIAPMLNEACIPYKAIVTEHAGHASELMKSIKLSEWYGVVIISGDGLIFETINGIMQRDDWTSAIKVPIGCLPGGSGNALCCSINYAAGREPLDSSMVLHSTFILAKHRVVPMDLVIVHIPNRTIFSFLSVTWGIVADIDFESEKYRKLGEARFTVGAIKRIIGLRTYKGRISFLPIAAYSPRANCNKVLTKVRKFSLHSQSSSKSTLHSLDSKNSSSDLSNGCYKKNTDLAEVQVWPADSRAVDSLDGGHCKNGVEAERNNEVEAERNSGNVCNDPHQGDYASKTVSADDSDLSVEHGSFASRLSHVGGGDTTATRTSNLNHPGSSENGKICFGIPLDPSSKSADHAHSPSDCSTSPQRETIPNNSDSVPSTAVGGSNEHGSTTGAQRNNCDKPHTYTGNGCRVESNHRMTILSDTKEVKVEQEIYHVQKSNHGPVPTPLLVPLDQDVPSNWVTLDGNFVLAIAVYQTHLGSDMLAAPDARLNDGHIHLMMVREGISRNALFNLFLTFDQGQHINSPHVDVVKVLAFRFEPASKDGNIMVDGERFDPTPIQGQILPELARIMAIR